jgi:hypothetical protein
MRYKAKSIAALQLALGSLPDKMRVEVEPDIEVSAKTVGDLRKVTAWPETTLRSPGREVLEMGARFCCTQARLRSLDTKRSTSLDV